MDAISVEQLRTLCNANDVSCRDSNGRLVKRPVLLRRLQQAQSQTGGAMSPEKVWTKYGIELKDRLTKDKKYKGSVDSLPSAFTDKHPKYLEWMVTSYLNGGIRLYEDIASRVYPALDTYLKLLHKRLLNSRDANGIPITDVKAFQQTLTEKPWLNQTNLLNYCGLSGCTSVIKKLKVVKPGLEGLLDNYSEDLESIDDVYHPDPGTLYFDGETIRIYKLSNKEEACYYGRGTRWCTAAKNDNMFEEYNEDNTLYVIIPKNPRHKGEKYQISIPDDDGDIEDLMDETDEPIELKDLVTLYPEIIQIHAIDKYYQELREEELRELTYSRMFGKRLAEYAEYKFYNTVDDQLITIVQNKIPKSIGIIDILSKKVTMIEGKFESIAEGLFFILEDMVYPPVGILSLKASMGEQPPIWLMVILYPYIPTQILDSSDHLMVSTMLIQEPLILEDALMHHNDAVVDVLVALLTDMYPPPVSYLSTDHPLYGFSDTHTKQAVYDIITTVYRKLNMGIQGKRFEASRHILANKSSDLFRDVFVTYKGSRLDIRATLSAIVVESINWANGTDNRRASKAGTIDKKFIELFEELYSNIEQYIQHFERRYIKQLSSIIPTDVEIITHRQIKTLYNILESHGTYLSPKIKQMSLISAKYTL
jgi:hypothetical protein